jgi:hypothetical protein
MQNHDWIDLFRPIPAEQHNTLVLTTVSGIDLTIDTVLRTDPAVLVFRGRISGSTDDGRVFFLPYRQIDFLQINRQVKEIEIREMFGEVQADGGKRSSDLYPAASSPRSSAVYSAVGVCPTGPSQHGTAPKPSAIVASGGPATAGPIQRTGKSFAGTTAAPQLPNAPAAVNTGNSSGDPPTPPRNSILERLRAQRNAILPPRPPAR